MTGHRHQTQTGLRPDGGLSSICLRRSAIKSWKDARHTETPLSLYEDSRSKSRRPRGLPYFPGFAVGGGPGGTSDAAISEIDFQDPSACFLYTSTTLPLSFTGFFETGSVTVIA